MFDALLKTKFHNKCKSLIKLTKARLELIKRKRNAMQKYLKADITDLLKNNLDFDAYSRAEGYLVELNLSSCYDFIEKSCGCISNHLSVMSKERECPEDCKEAVSTLMFAAARFADLPELRELRSLFTKRYGNSVELYVNKEFVAMLKSPPPSKDMKFQMLQEIAHESGLEWSSKALEQKLYKPPAPERDGSKNITDSRDMQNKPRDTTVGTKRGFTSNGLEKVIVDGNQLHNTWKNPTIDHKQDASTNREGKNSSYSSTSSSGEENSNDDKGQLKYSAIPPPYTRPSVSKIDSSPAVRPTVSDTEMVAQKKLNEDREKESKPKEKPRSVRSRPLKPPAGNEKVGFAKGDVKEKKKALEGKEKETDEEEKMMDQLLMHYSNKVEGKQHTVPEYSRRTRAASLPIEPTGPLEVEAPARASSFQQNLSDTEQGQPKLLDYDDFVARLAVLRGEGK